MSSSKRKNAQSSDFKRIKAKVGKKAKRQHDTDVSFRSASLHIGQSVQENDEQEKKDSLQVLVSSRGKSLHDLLSTASKHPAASARVSSLRGVLDIVKRHRTDSLLPNLSTLIPVCIHSCVDEDNDVRSNGIEALSSLLQQLPEKRIQPFGALLVARVSSALHSLDASTRVHGVKLVNLLCTTCPSLAIVFVDKLMTPFSDLLADDRTKKSIDEILQSLISLLRLNTAKTMAKPTILPTLYHASSNYDVSHVQARNKYYEHPDLAYTAGGRARNAIIQTRRSVDILSKKIELISHLSCQRGFASSSTIGKNKVIVSRRQQNSRDDFFQIKCKSNLISKLRDCLIESINLRNEPTMISNTRIARSMMTEPQDSTNYPRLILIIRSIRYLMDFDVYYEDGDTFDTYKIELEKITQQIGSVLIDAFPVDQNFSALRSANNINSTSIDHFNAVIAMCVLDLSRKIYKPDEPAEDDKIEGWMKTICSYIISRIRHVIDIENASSPDLDMTCQFLRRFGTDTAFSDNIDSVLEIFEELLFSNKDVELARSNAVRRISMIMMDLIEFSNFSLTDEPNSTKSKAFVQFVKSVPFYLEMWATDFLFESGRFLDGLHKLIRGCKGSCNIPLIEHIRNEWHKLVSDRGNSLTIFENYPSNLQETYLGIIILLRRPCELTLKHLALICSRLTLKPETPSNKRTASQLIFESITSIRKFIPMQRYLTFLFQSVGISRHAREMRLFKTMSTGRDSDPSSQTVFREYFFAADFSLSRMARALVESGSMKVLQMILPQLRTWQHTSLNDVSSTEFLLKMRASHIILAYFFLLNQSKEGGKVLEGPCIFECMDGALTIDEITHSIWRFIYCITREEEAMDFRLKLTSPIVATLSSKLDILIAMILKISTSLHTPGLSKAEKKNLKFIMVDWMEDPRLKDSFTSLPSSTNVHLNEILTIPSDSLHAKEHASVVLLQQVP